jgi:hypothetical protein
VSSSVHEKCKTWTKKFCMPYSPSKMRYRVWRSCPCTPNELLLDHFVTLHSSDELKLGTLMYHHMSKGFTILSCYIGLFFLKLPWSNSKTRCHSWSMYHNYFTKHVKHNVMSWYITFWAHNTSWPVQKDSNTVHIIWSTLVWPKFVKFKGNS